ncbi:MAG: dipicolinate synthase subunit B [Bacilli bacterium]|nr:dipicolinate synthase subunit B [Bacilli bacterium]
MKIGFAITSSFCTFNKVIDTLIELKACEYDIYPIISENIEKYDTRFGKSNDFIEKVEMITGHKVVKDIVEAEHFGPKNKMDLMVVLPATGDFIAKMANGITDNPVNLAVKATLRNQSPIVIAISTNDGLSLNARNIMDLYNRKDVYFVPFGQDNYKDKPNSLISHYDMLIPTIEQALENKQIQPVIKEYKK